MTHHSYMSGKLCFKVWWVSHLLSLAGAQVGTPSSVKHGPKILKHQMQKLQKKDHQLQETISLFYLIPFFITDFSWFAPKRNVQIITIFNLFYLYFKSWIVSRIWQGLALSASSGNVNPLPLIPNTSSPFPLFSTLSLFIEKPQGAIRHTRNILLVFMEWTL